MAKNVHRFLIEITPKAKTLPVESFLEVVEEMIGVVRDVDRKLSATKRPRLRWGIERMSMNSPAVIEVIGVSDEQIADDVVERSLKGIGQLTRQAKILPASFEDRTAERVRRMGYLLNDGILAMRIQRGSRLHAEPTQQTAENVDAILAKNYVMADGTLEGMLETFDIHGREKFSIYDRLTAFRTSCYFDDALYAKSYRAIGKRVMVTGRIKFNRSGDAVQMDAEQLDVVKDTNLPDFRRGKGLGYLQGVDPVALIRKSRDAEG